MVYQLWVIASVLALVVAVFFIFPVWRNRREKNELIVIGDQDQSLVAENVRLFREQLNDLELQRNDSRISEQEFSGLKLELERNLLQACQSVNPIKLGNPSSSFQWLYFLAFIIFLIISAGLYKQLGASADLQIMDIVSRKQLSDYQAMQNKKMIDISLTRELQASLYERLQQVPDNLHYWLLAAQLASEQNDFARVAVAYEEILKRDPSIGWVKAELAQALFLRDKHQMTERIGQLARESLEVDSRNTTALGLLGIYELSKKNYLVAIRHWHNAVNLLGVNSESGRGLLQGIERAKTLYLAEGGAASALDHLLDVKKIIVHLSLSDQVNAQPDQLVYVYARAWQGPKMPLAIYPIKVSQLPTTIVLDETMSMTPELSLANAAQIEVIARISEDGSAMAKPGEWQVSQGPFDINKLPESVTLVIDKRME